MGETYFATWPVALYGVVFLLAGFAYYLLVHSLVALHGQDSLLAKAVGRDVKGWASVIGYVVGVAAAFVNSWLAFAIYILVAAMWFLPDRRIEKRLK